MSDRLPEKVVQHSWRDPAIHLAHEADARRLTRNSLLCTAVIYLHLLAVAAALVPPWTAAITAMLLVPRWMIAVHELFHLRSDREVDPVTWLQPLVFTPLSLGYREMLANHRSHHRFMSTRRDVEFYQLRGTPAAGFINAMTAPEQMWMRWVLEQGVDRQLALTTVLRCALFAGFAGVCGASFLWYWLPARCAYGISYFVFFYCLHRRGDAMGVYRLALPSGVANFITLFYGADLVEAILHHDVHHAQPRIAARDLAASRAVIGGS